MKWPYLNFTLDIGWIEIHTELWNFRYELDQRTWVRLFVSVFKYKFDFYLYAPEKWHIGRSR